MSDWKKLLNRPPIIFSMVAAILTPIAVAWQKPLFTALATGLTAASGLVASQFTTKA